MVVDVGKASWCCNDEVAVGVEAVDLLLSTLASNHQCCADSHLSTSNSFHEGLNLHGELAIGDEDQHDEIGEYLIRFVLAVRNEVENGRNPAEAG